MRRLMWVRRVSALLLAVCFLAGPMEALIPDVHHNGSELEASRERSDAGVVKLVAESAHLPSNSPSHNQLPAPVGSHPVHADHCGHSHVANLPATMVIAGVPIAAENESSPPLLGSTSVAIAPRLRPPLA